MSTLGRIGAIVRFVLLVGCIALPSLAQASVTVTTFGPATFVRATSTPVTQTATFPGLAGPGTLELRAAGVSAATVKVNGVLVAGPDEFRPRVGLLSTALNLQTRNRIEVELRGAPGAALQVTVTQVVDAPAAAAIGAEGGTLAVTDPHSPLFGARLEVPPGALAEAALITLDQADDAPPFAPGDPPLSPVRLSPSGLTFATPAALTLPYAPEMLDADASIGEETLSMYTYAAEIGRWLSLSTDAVDVDGKRVRSTSIDHFSLFGLHDDRIVEECAPGSKPAGTHLPVVLVHGFQALSADGFVCGYGTEEGMFDDGTERRTFGDLRSVVAADAELSQTDVYMFLYDSGRDIARSGKNLADAVEKVRQCYTEPPAGVTLVAHSMGGLVARAATETLAERGQPVPVFKMATLATPHTGTALSLVASIGSVVAGPHVVAGAMAACRSVYRDGSLRSVPGGSGQLRDGLGRLERQSAHRSEAAARERAGLQPLHRR